LDLLLQIRKSKFFFAELGPAFLQAFGELDFEFGNLRVCLHQTLIGSFTLFPGFFHRCGHFLLALGHDCELCFVGLSL
jgi:hypothetical protein